MKLPRTIAIVAMPGVQLLDVSGPLDVFAEANVQERRDVYRLLMESGPFRVQGCHLSGAGLSARVTRAPVTVTQPLACLAAPGDPPDEDLGGPAAYSDWLESSSPSWALHQIQELLDESLNDEQFRAEAHDILADTRRAQPRR